MRDDMAYLDVPLVGKPDFEQRIGDTQVRYRRISDLSMRGWRAARTWSFPSCFSGSRRTSASTTCTTSAPASRTTGCRNAWRRCRS